MDGLEAVNKLNTGAKYDLVLMDIIMPNLDGVSATHLVRQFDQTTPIIAMTSNIRSDDIGMYFQHGKPSSVRLMSVRANTGRNERCSTQAFHKGGTAEHAGEASTAPQEACGRWLRSYAPTIELRQARSEE